MKKLSTIYFGNQKLLFSILFGIIFVVFLPLIIQGNRPGDPVSQPTPSPSTTMKTVFASVETDPVPHNRDSADDPLIWIHPADPSMSTIMGNDKNGAYEVYDLSGHLLQSIQIDVANTDIRYNFPLGGERVTIVVGFSASRNGLVIWKVNPETRTLEEVSAKKVEGRSGGGALYHSPITGNTYWFANRDGQLYQYLLADDGTGKVTSTLVRSVKYGSGQGEGTVCDDILGFVYVSDESTGLWKLSAEPDGGDGKVQVDMPVSKGGHFSPDLEGLSIYYRSDGTGYLFASSQGNNSYVVYQREGNNGYIGAFQIGEGAVDGTESTDGIDVTNFPLGSAFPYGIFVAQDGGNIDNGKKTNQNFKLVPFDQIANQLGLSMDTSWDPRSIGQ